MRDTIFALATAPGRAAVAVVRISGPGARGAIEAMAGQPPTPRKVGLRRLRDSEGGLIDQSLVLWLPAPESFTGEDQAELHLHGGAAVVEAALDALARLGLRLAEPGEFTRRAFENGKLELSEAEAVADLVDAETTAQRRQALAQLGGALAARYETWRGTLLDSLAWLEAEIDFPDEDLPQALAERAGGPLRGLRAELEAELSDTRGERVREGFRVALVGAANAGKSSLINAMSGRDAAIVTEIPGTTRDVIEAPLVLRGYRVLLADTAGLRSTPDRIEAEGVRRARAWGSSADLRLWVVDASASDGHWTEAIGLACAGDLLVLAKADLKPGADAGAAQEHARGMGLEAVESTVRTPEGVQRLVSRLGELVAERLAGSDFPAATRLRHRDLLREASGHLDRAIGRLEAGGAELVAEDVRLAARALERLSGRIDPEAVLDRVFSSFCIGK